MKPIYLIAWIATWALGAAACSDTSGGTGVQSPVVTAEAVAGSDGQSALRGTALPQTLRVRVLADGAPLDGAVVSWEPSAGTIQGTSDATDVDGVASAVWVLGDLPGPMTASASVEGMDGSPVRFTATALPLVRLIADPAGDGQSGYAGALLGIPLRARVYVEGTPTAGHAVIWLSSEVGSIPVYSTTDGAGYASIPPRLPIALGEVTYTASLSGAVGSPVVFHANSLAGAGFSITKEDGDGQALPANLPAFWPLVALVKDLDGQPIPGQPVIWSVVGGPVAIESVLDVTDVGGRVSARIAPSGGIAGAGVVRAELPGGLVFAHFNIVVVPPAPLVILDPGPQSQFTSAINGSSPAVDTVAVGGQMTWLLGTEDLEDHAVTPVGELEFFGGYLGYGSSIHGLTVTLSVAGTYYYEDPYSPGVIGTIVAR